MAAVCVPLLVANLEGDVFVRRPTTEAENGGARIPDALEELERWRLRHILQVRREDLKQGAVQL